MVKVVLILVIKRPLSSQWLISATKIDLYSNCLGLKDSAICKADLPRPFTIRISRRMLPFTHVSVFAVMIVKT